MHRGGAIYRKSMKSNNIHHKKKHKHKYNHISEIFKNHYKNLEKKSKIHSSKEQDVSPINTLSYGHCLIQTTFFILQVIKSLMLMVFPLVGWLKDLILLVY